MNEEKNARQRIVDAYLDALNTKRYDKITVSSVIKNAKINRSTFYRHFLDIYDLYENICGETAEKIVCEVCDSMKRIFAEGYSIGQMNEAYEAIFGIFVDNKNIISLLSGSRGSLMLLKKFRDKCEKRLSGLFPLFDENDSVDYQTGLLADVSVLFVYCMYAFRTGEDLLKLREILPDTPMKRDFMSNILTVNDILNDEKPSIEYKLLMATYETWVKRKTINLTVRDITEAAGISRTEFYLCHKNIADFYAGFENIATYVLAKYVLEIALADIDKIKGVEFNVKELAENMKSFIGSIDYMKLFTFLFRTCGATVDKYFQIMKRENGEQYMSGQEYNIMFYLCSVFNIVVRYAISGNEEHFISSMSLADNFKKML